MIKNMKKHLKNEKGLTLVELLAVIVILAIIAAIAIPAIGNIIANSKYNAIKSDGINVINAAQLYYLDTEINDTNKDGVTVKMLKDDKYLDNPGTIPDEAKVSAATPNALTVVDANAIIFDGKKVTFTDATIEDINANDQKGSDTGPFDIGS